MRLYPSPNSMLDEQRSLHTTPGTYGAQFFEEELHKIVTFDGTANKGAIGFVPIFNCQGLVEIVHIIPRCTLSLVGAGATISLGPSNSTTLLIPAFAAPSIVTGKFWLDAGTGVYDNLAIPAALKNVAVEADIFATIAVANITAGVIDFEIIWRPIQAGAILVAL